MQFWGEQCANHRLAKKLSFTAARADDGKEHDVHYPDVKRGYLPVIMDVTMPGHARAGLR